MANQAQRHKLLWPVFMSYSLLFWRQVILHHRECLKNGWYYYRIILVRHENFRFPVRFEVDTLVHCYWNRSFWLTWIELSFSLVLSIRFHTRNFTEFKVTYRDFPEGERGQRGAEYVELMHRRVWSYWRGSQVSPLVRIQWRRLKVVFSPNSGIKQTTNVLQNPSLLLSVVSDTPLHQPPASAIAT